MPRNRGITGQQWSTCDRCGVEYPMSQLGAQKGLVLCYAKCMDNLEIERHPQKVAQAIEQGADEEGVDTRFIDPAFFSGEGDEIL